MSHDGIDLLRDPSLVSQLGCAAGASLISQGDGTVALLPGLVEEGSGARGAKEPLLLVSIGRRRSLVARDILRRS